LNAEKSNMSDYFTTFVPLVTIIISFYITDIKDYKGSFALN